MFEVGQEHDGWSVDAQLGAGGMGAVYRCHKVGLPEVIAAIKVIIHSDPEAKERFRREAVALSRLAHENVVRFRDVQCQEEPWYIVMDLVEGRTLASLLQTPMPLSRVYALSAQLAEAIRYIHDKGLRHRDIKPANIIVDKYDKLILVDFGIAVREGDPRVTTYGRCGSPSYAPPEWRSRGVDEVAWDVYSLGQVIFEMCTGQTAFPGESLDDIVLLKRQVPSLDPGETVPAVLRECIRDATSFDPTRRPTAAKIADAIALARAGAPPPPSAPPELRTVVLPEPVMLAPPESLPKTERQTGFRRLGVVALAIAIAIGACFGVS